MVSPFPRGAWAAALLLLVWFLGSSPAQATSVGAMPAQPAGVVDQAEILSRSTENALTQGFGTLADTTNQQVHVVTLHRLDYGVTPQDFADRLFERWFPTPEIQARQVLLVLDSVTNGAGLRWGKDIPLDQSLADSITRETLQVPLRQGNYNQGLLDVAERLGAVLAGEPDPGPPVVTAVWEPESNFPKSPQGSGATLWVVGLLLAATVIPMATYYFYQFLQSRA